MNKVTTINLNGKAYQVEEAGYELLRKYLDQAGVKLEGNPDKTEIMGDFEQAIADSDQFSRPDRTADMDRPGDDPIQDGDARRYFGAAKSDAAQDLRQHQRGRRRNQRQQRAATRIPRQLPNYLGSTRRQFPSTERRILGFGF